MSGQIFISYRRADSAAIAGRIADRLLPHFGEDRIFMDIDTIEAGENFVKRLDAALSSSDAVIVVIGDKWLTITDDANQRRLDDQKDFVRQEIDTALRRGVRIIPVLVNDARMPTTADLPKSIRRLSERQAITVRNQGFHSDMDHLIASLERALEQAEQERLEAQKKADEEAERATREKAEKEKRESLENKLRGEIKDLQAQLEIVERKAKEETEEKYRSQIDDLRGKLSATEQEIQEEAARKARKIWIAELIEEGRNNLLQKNWDIARKKFKLALEYAAAESDESEDAAEALKKVQLGELMEAADQAATEQDWATVKKKLGLSLQLDPDNGEIKRKLEDAELASKYEEAIKNFKHRKYEHALLLFNEIHEINPAYEEVPIYLEELKSRKIQSYLLISKILKVFFLTTAIGFFYWAVSGLVGLLIIYIIGLFIDNYNPGNVFYNGVVVAIALVMPSVVFEITNEKRFPKKSLSLNYLLVGLVGQAPLITVLICFGHIFGSMGGIIGFVCGLIFYFILSFVYIGM